MPQSNLFWLALEFILGASAGILAERRKVNEYKALLCVGGAMMAGELMRWLLSSDAPSATAGELIQSVLPFVALIAWVLMGVHFRYSVRRDLEKAVSVQADENRKLPATVRAAEDRLDHLRSEVISRFSEMTARLEKVESTCKAAEDGVASAYKSATDANVSVMAKMKDLLEFVSSGDNSLRGKDDDLQNQINTVRNNCGVLNQYTEKKIQDLSAMITNVAGATADVLGKFERLMRCSIRQEYNYAVIGCEAARGLLTVNTANMPEIGEPGHSVWVFPSGNDPNIYPNTSLKYTIKQLHRAGEVTSISVAEALISGLEGGILVTRPWVSCGLEQK